jgi:hypothetical protein
VSNFLNEEILRRGGRHAVNVAASATENDVERRQDELFAAGGAGTGFARDDAVGADHGTRWAFGLLLGFVFEILGEMKAVAGIGAKLGTFLLFRGAFLFCCGLAFWRAGYLIVVGSALKVGKNLIGIQNQLELARCIVVSRVAVWMITKYRLAIGPLDFVLARAALDS